jgi:cation:H+ antiporter
MLEEIISQNQLFFHIVVVVSSLYVLAKSSDLAVYSVSRYASKLGLSDCIIGILVVSIASSMPELVSSVTGSGFNQPGIVVGTIFGSNLVELALVIGIAAFLSKKMSTESKVLEKSGFLIWLFMIMPFLFLLDGELSRIDGFLLVASFFIYAIFLWKKEGELGEIKKNVKLKNIWRDGLIFSLNIVVLLLSGMFLVFSSVSLARDIGVTPYIIGLTVIALGSSMSDLMVSLKSIKQKHAGVGYGNAIGSSIVKSLLFLGIIAIVKPVVFTASSLWNIMIFMTVILGLVLWWAKKGFISRSQGLILIMVYVVFIFLQLWLH